MRTCKCLRQEEVNGGGLYASLLRSHVFKFSYPKPGMACFMHKETSSCRDMCVNWA
jgi:hypothetical protein